VGINGDNGPMKRGSVKPAKTQTLDTKNIMRIRTRKMNPKELDQYKRLFEEILELIPISKLEFSIQASGDPLMMVLYHHLMVAENEINQNQRAKDLFRKTMILAIYSLKDPVYADPLKWIMSKINMKKYNVKAPKEWRINIYGRDHGPK
jgi:hypothetical protein